MPQVGSTEDRYRVMHRYKVLQEVLEQQKRAREGFVAPASRRQRLVSPQGPVRPAGMAEAPVAAASLLTAALSSRRNESTSA